MSQLTQTRSRLDLRPYTGRLIIATAILHITLGIAFYAKPLHDIAAAGLLDTISNADRDAAFWFMFGGMLWLMIGYLAHWTQRKTGTLPAAFGWGTIALSIAGIIIMPASGAWLVLGLGVLILAVARSS